jgi:hypothetical protein
LPTGRSSTTLIVRPRLGKFSTKKKSVHIFLLDQSAHRRNSRCSTIVSSFRTGKHSNAFRNLRTRKRLMVLAAAIDHLCRFPIYIFINHLRSCLQTGTSMRNSCLLLLCADNGNEDGCVKRDLVHVLLTHTTKLEPCNYLPSNMALSNQEWYPISTSSTEKFMNPNCASSHLVRSSSDSSSFLPERGWIFPNQKTKSQQHLCLFYGSLCTKNASWYLQVLCEL